MNPKKEHNVASFSMILLMHIFVGKEFPNTGWLLTYHSWTGIGDFSLEGDPLVVRPLFVSKGPQEGPPDVIHGVETHS